MSNWSFVFDGFLHIARARLASTRTDARQVHHVGRDIGVVGVEKLRFGHVGGQMREETWRHGLAHVGRDFALQKLDQGYVCHALWHVRCSLFGRVSLLLATFFF